MLSEYQSNKIQEIIEKTTFDYELEKCQLEAGLISLCNSSPEVLLQTIIDISWEAAAMYIEEIKEMQCVNEDWKLSNNYENNKIRNICTIRRIVELVECTNLGEDKFEIALQKIYELQEYKTQEDIHSIHMYTLLRNVSEDIKVLAVDKPETLLWLFCKLNSSKECQALHELLQGLKVL